MIGFMRYFFFIVLLTKSFFIYALPEHSSGIVNHNDLIRMMLGLLLILSIIIGLSMLVKKLQSVNLVSSNGFQSIASMTLGPKEKIVLLKVSGRYLLIGVASGAVNLLHDFGEQTPVGFDFVSKMTFAKLLKTTMGKSDSES